MSKAPNNKPVRKVSPDPEPEKRGRGQGNHHGNHNAGRHFLRAGSLPKQLKYIEVRLNAFRRNLEAAVLAQKGELNVVDAGLISSCMKWERHGALCNHWLRVENEKLTPADRMRFSEQIAKASDNRDRALQKLGLDRKDTAPWIVGSVIEKDTK